MEYARGLETEAGRIGPGTGQGSSVKQRLDILMVERGLAPTRTQAQALIMAGQVSANGRRLEKPGQSVDAALELHVKDQPRYVGRAGDKLASVAGPLGLDFAGKVVLDVG